MAWGVHLGPVVVEQILGAIKGSLIIPPEEVVPFREFRRNPAKALEVLRGYIAPYTSVVFPANLGPNLHWIAVEIQRPRLSSRGSEPGNIVFYDSLSEFSGNCEEVGSWMPRSSVARDQMLPRSHNHPSYRLALQGLRKKASEVADMLFPGAPRWQAEFAEVPQQPDKSNACAVYTCAFCEALAREPPLSREDIARMAVMSRKGFYDTVKGYYTQWPLSPEAKK